MQEGGHASTGTENSYRIPRGDGWVAIACGGQVSSVTCGQPATCLMSNFTV